jgi:carboxymethylenebutenolidase
MQHLFLAIGLVTLGLTAGLPRAAAQALQPTPQAAPSADKWWWDEAWWREGRIEVPQNHAVTVHQIAYRSGDIEVPAYVFRPKDDKRYPAVLFQHGRRGLDELVRLHARRLAARGFIVLAPDIWTARFIDPYPIEHDYAVENDVDAGVDALLALPDVSTDKACFYSHTRGGYMTLKVAVTKGRQEKDVVCYVSYYPHMQDPNAPEPMQVYQYAPEADDLRIPALIFIGEKEQYHRRRSIETAVRSMKDLGRPVRLVIYPGVGRGFDFRPKYMRTLADHLASQDALQRAARFMRKHLAPHAKPSAAQARK